MGALEGDTYCEFEKKFNVLNTHAPINNIQDGQAAHRWGEDKKTPPTSEILHTYLTVIKLDTVITYLKKIKKIYESRLKPLELY